MASCSSSGDAGGVVVHGKIPKETRQFTWTLADFAELKRFSEEMMNAIRVEFEMGASIGLPVTLQCSLTGRMKHGREWMKVVVKCTKVPEGVTEAMAFAELKIGTYFRSRFETVRNLVGHSWGWRCIPKDEKPSNLPLDSNGGLPLDITVILYNVQGPLSTVQLPGTLENLTARFQERFLQTLQRDMGKLRQDPVASAGAPEIVKLVSNDGKEFPVNWLILAARSPVFRLMFQTPMSEVEQGLVKLSDIGGEALEVFLEFVHTATLADKWKEPGILEEVTRAAHKYEIQDLLDFMDEAIGLVCSLQDYGRMYRLARTLELKKAEVVLLKKFREQGNQPQGVKKMKLLCDNLAFGEDYPGE